MQPSWEARVCSSPLVGRDDVRGSSTFVGHCSSAPRAKELSPSLAQFLYGKATDLELDKGMSEAG